MNDHSPFPLYRRLLYFLIALFIIATTVLQMWRLQKRWKEPVAPKPSVADVLPARARILSETVRESIDDSIDGLPSFTDLALATAMGMDSCPFTESYCRGRLGVPRLNRVRKLLDQIDDSQKPHYKVVFLQKIEDSMAGYVQSRKEMLAELDRAKGGVTVSEPRPYDRKRAIAGALVYILTEWDCHDALPTFTRLLEQPDPIPVNRLFLLYSCHILLEALPTDNLSPNKRDRLVEYRRLAQKTFPNVSRVRVPAWNAKFDETDFRAVIVGQPIPIESEPGIQLRIYPDLSHLEDPNTFQLHEEAAALQRAMLSFLREK